MMEFGLDETDPDSQPRYGSRAARAVSASNTDQDCRTRSRSGVDLTGFVGRFAGGARSVDQALLAEVTGRLRRFGPDDSSFP
jgi:hypothetical protein